MNKTTPRRKNSLAKVKNDERPSTPVAIDALPPKPVKAHSGHNVDLQPVVEKLTNEVNALTEKLKKTERGNVELETERNTYLYQINELKKRHEGEIHTLEETLEEHKARQEDMQERLLRIEKVERKIVDLYLEMKDRSADVVNSEEERRELERKEREELKRKNPLTVLDLLSASLRTLLAFKEDYEDELKVQIERRKTETQRQLEKMQRQLEEMEREKDLLKESTDKAVEERNEAVASKHSIIQERNNVVQQMKKDNSELIKLIRKQESQIDELHEMLALREHILEHKETRMMRITQLESQIQKDKLRYQFELNKFRAQNVKAEQSANKKLSVFTRMEAEKKNMEEKLRAMEVTLASYKNDVGRIKGMEAEKKMREAEKRLQEKEDELRRTVQELKRTRAQVEDLSKRNSEMKAEYDRIFTAALKEKSRKRDDEEKAMRDEIANRFHINSQHNPNLVDQYKKKLQEKEKEIVDLTKRVRRMILSEHRGSLSEKNFELERSRLLSELSQLRKQATAGSGSPTSLSATIGGSSVALAISAADLASDLDSMRSGGQTERALQELLHRNRELEEHLRDFENLKNIATTQAAAYEKLVAKSSAMGKSPKAALSSGDSSGPFPLQRSSSAMMNQASSAAISLDDDDPSGGSATAKQSTSDDDNALSVSFRQPTGAQGRRPLSAAPTRPHSSRSKRLSNVGSSHSTLKIGSLVPSET